MAEIIHIDLADAQATPSKPVFIDGRGAGNERYTRMMLCACALLGAAGSAQLYGLTLPSEMAEVHYDATAAAGQDKVMAAEGFLGDDATVNFNTTIDYAAFANNNWLVLLAGADGGWEFVENGAGAAQFQVANNSGKAQIQMGTAVTKGRRMRVLKLDTTKCLLYDLATNNAEDQVRGATVAWALPVDSGGFNGAQFTLKPITS